MRITYIGMGRMGQAVRSIAEARGHTTVNIIEAGDPINKETLEDADLVIECTLPQSSVPNIYKVLEHQKNLLVITTGWYEHLPEVKKAAKDAGVRFLWSSNYSIGVNLYFEILKKAAQWVNKLEEYDIWVQELHHRHKADAPSGTAKIIEEILLSAIDRKDTVVEDRLQRPLKPNEIHVSSTRGGEANFLHTVAFDAEADCITLTHFARNRKGYALGAVKAAEWLIKQPVGVYEMQDFLKTIFQ